MATTLFNRGGQIFFYICVCLYLFGDLTIYSAAIGKTLVDLSWYVRFYNLLFVIFP